MTRWIYTERAGVSALYLNLNRNKRSVAIDLRNDAGRDALLRLSEGFDVVVENSRPGALDRRGLGYDAIRARNPGMIYTSIHGFGEAGPDADRPVYDVLIQGRSGMVATQESPSGERDIVRNSVCDKLTSVVAAQAITAALFARERGAGGQHLHLSMLDAAIAFLWPDSLLNDTFVGDFVRQSPMSAGQRVFRTRDSHLLIAPTQQKNVEAMLEVLGASHLLKETRFATVASRIEHIDDWNETLQLLIEKRETRALAAELEKADVPHCVVSELDQIVDDPQVRHNELIVEQTHPEAGRFRQPRSPAVFGGTPLGPLRCAPTLGADTRAVLREGGFADGEIEALSAAGAFRAREV
jgi:crotonobetainyl-CoA:carnitine CoA-transferase CaiB-like acyl-CoA transferase